MIRSMTAAMLAILVSGPAFAQGTSGAPGAAKPAAPSVPATPASPGVLKPPAVDPGIRVRVPPSTTSRTPIIRPPGTKGGQPDVVPK